MKRNRVTDTLRRGALAVVPLAVSGYLVYAGVRIVYQAVASADILVPKGWSRLPYHAVLQPILTVLALLLALTLVGVVSRAVVGRLIGRLVRAVMGRIPLLRSLYPALRKMATSLFAGDRSVFVHPVLVPFPFAGRSSVGFRTARMCFSQEDIEGYEAVFVPTVPSPTTGLLMYFRPSQVAASGLSTEQALRLIVSAGLLSPGAAPNTAPRRKRRRRRGPWARALMTGLTVLLPLAFTTYVGYALFQAIMRIFGFAGAWLPASLADRRPMEAAAALLALLLSLAAILLVGALASTVVGRAAQSAVHRLAEAVPFAGDLYRGLRMLLEALVPVDRSQGYSRVGLIAFLGPQARMIALITGEATPELACGCAGGAYTARPTSAAASSRSSPRTRSSCWT